MKNKIISIVVTLVLAVSMILGVAIVANANGAQEDSEAFKGGALNLKENITINMYVAKADVDALADATVTITLPDGSTDATQTVASAKVENDCYIFTAECAVKDYDKAATITITGTNGSITGTYSVKDYCDAYTSGEFAALVDALEAYGEAAKYYFDKAQTNPNESAAPSVKAKAPVKAGAVDGLTHRSATLLLETETTIRHYFELADGKSKDGYTFFLDKDADGQYDAGEELTPAEKEGLLYVDITGIAPTELHKYYTVGVTDGTATYTCTYGVKNYLANKCASENAELKALVAAIAAYAKEAAMVNATFLLYDDFDGETINLASSAGAANYTLENGKLTWTPAAGATLQHKDDAEMLLANTTSPDGCYTYSFKFTVKSLASGQFYARFYPTSSEKRLWCFESDGRLMTQASSSDGTRVQIGKITAGETISVDVVVDFNNDEMHYYLNGNFAETVDVALDLDAAYNGAKPSRTLQFRAAAAGASFTFDYVKIAVGNIYG